MNRYVGDFTPGKTVRLTFNTNKADGTPITLAGTPVVSVYKDASTTESTTGVTLTVDFDARTGLHQAIIDTSADGTFYAAGSDFRAVITTGTVDSISVVGAVIGGFSLANRSALRPTTADRTLDVSASSKAPATLAAGDVSGNVPTDLQTIKTQTVTCAAGVTVLASVGTAATSTAQTGDNYARLGAPAGASVSADIAAVKTDTGNLVTRITSTLFNGITSLAQWLGLLAGKQTGNATARTELRATGAGSGTFDETTDSQEALRDRGDAAWTTSTLTAAAVWDLATAGHTTSGTFGAAMNAAGSAGDPWSTSVPGAYGAGTAGFILGTNLNATVSSRLATTGYTAPLDAAGTRAAVGLASASLDTQIAALPVAVRDVNNTTPAASSLGAAVNAAGGGGGGNVTVGGYAAGQDPATLVLGATASSWNTAGTIGAKINAAGGASDPMAAVAVNTTTYGQILVGLAAVMLGDVTENAPAHNMTTFSDVNDPNTTRVVSTNSPTGRTVTIS